MYSASAKMLGLPSIVCHTSPFEARAHVCVCVCVCACDTYHTHTNTHKKGNIVFHQCPFKLPPAPSRHAVQIAARRLVACVTSEREKEDYS
jgi:hypothetical protein